MGQRDYFYKKPTLGQNNNALIILFSINAFFFIVLNFLKIVYLLDGLGEAAEGLFRSKVLYWFTLSPEVKLLLEKPWSLLVYMFSNYSIMGFISNMLWLWAFGYVLQDLVGNNKLIPTYLYGGFVGGLVYVLSSSLVPTVHQGINAHFLLEGSSAAIVAVAVATTTLSPKYKIFQHIGSGFALWILTLFFLAVDISFIAASNNMLAIAASHIAAAIVGYLFVKQLQNGNDWSQWMYNVVYKIDDLYNPEKKHKNRKQTEKIFYKTNTPVFSKSMNVTTQRVDEILDKINKKGYDNLSVEEKTFLERASKATE